MIKVDYFIGREFKKKQDKDYYKYVYSEWYEKIKKSIDAQFICYPEFGGKGFKKNVRRLFKNRVYDIITPRHVSKCRRKDSILHVLSLGFSEILNKKQKYPTILTVYDIGALLPNAKEIVPLLWNRYQKSRAISSIKNADKIIAISEYTKQEIIMHLKVNGDKIHVIHLAVNHDIFYPRKYDSKLAMEYGLSSNAVKIINVGTDQPRKNIETILEVINILKKKKLDVQFIKVGRFVENSTQHKKLLGMIEEYGLEEQVIFHKYVPEEDLPFLYSYSDLMIYPNLYDGFGLTLLESMACGCPVICSNTTCIPEVVGDGAITVDPLNVNKIADYAYELLNNDSISRHYKEAGIKRAKEFSWEKTAHGILKLYKSLV